MTRWSWLGILTPMVGSTPVLVGPYRSTEELGPVVHDLTVRGARKQEGTWELALHRDGMRVSKGSESFVYSREQIAGTAKVMLFGQSDAVLVLDGWKTGLRLDSFSRDVFRAWMGPYLQKWGGAEALRSEPGSVLGGIVSVALWAWLGGWFLLTYGVVSLGVAAGRRVRPGRWLFLGSAAKSLVVFVVCGADVLFAGRSPWWLLLCLVLAFGGTAAFVKHRFFAPVPIELE